MSKHETRTPTAAAAQKSVFRHYLVGRKRIFDTHFEFERGQEYSELDNARTNHHGFDKEPSSCVYCRVMYAFIFKRAVSTGHATTSEIERRSGIRFAPGRRLEFTLQTGTLDDLKQCLVFNRLRNL